MKWQTFQLCLDYKTIYKTMISQFNTFNETLDNWSNFTASIQSKDPFKKEPLDDAALKNNLNKTAYNGCRAYKEINEERTCIKSNGYSTIERIDNASNPACFMGIRYVKIIEPGWSQFRVSPRTPKMSNWRKVLLKASLLWKINLGKFDDCTRCD